MITIFDLTRGMSMEHQYMVPAIVVAVMSVSLIFMIREPTIKDHRQLQDGTLEVEVVDVNRPACERFTKLTSEVSKEIREKPKYMFVFVCLMVSRLMNILFAVYIQLWVMSFHKSGVLESDEESVKTYRNIVIWMQVATLFTMPIFGYYSDRADPRIIIPLTFLARGIVAISFRCIDHPQSWEAYLLAVLLTVTSVV